MSDAPPPLNRRSLSLATGVAYLVSHITSVAALVLLVSGAHLAAIRAGILLELVLAMAVLVSGLGVQLLLRDQAPMLAGTFAGLRTLEAAVIASGTLPLLSWGGGALDSEVALALHAAAFMVGQSLVISVNTIVLGVLLLSTRAVPRWMAHLGSAGGVLVLVSNLAQFWGLLTARAVAGVLALPVFAFEISFAFYLILRGAGAPAARRGVPWLAAT